MLTDKQRWFCDEKLKTRLTNTGIRGIVWDNFTGYFVVRDNDKAYIDEFNDLTEAVETLVCQVYGFPKIEPDTVFDVIEYLGAEKHLR